MRKIIPYGRQEITPEDIEAVTSVLQSDFLTQGPEVEKFENAFSKYIGAPYSTAVSNGTTALHLAALALGAAPGKRVITSPISFAASANCIGYCGAEIDFCDIDPQTYLLDIHSVRNRLKAAKERPYSGIVLVDFAGYPCALDEWRNLADEFGLWILEDACHAPGASFLDKKGNRNFSGQGKFTESAIFSFHPVKHIACGEGGMITTASHSLDTNHKLMRSHGIVRDSELLLQKSEGMWYYEMQALGFNYRLTDIQAALGTSQLKRASQNLKKRALIANRYFESLKDLPIKLPFVSDFVEHAWHLFVIQTDQRNELFNFLRANGVFPQVHYIPIHLQPYYTKLGFQKGDFPLAEAYYHKCLTLPIFPSMTEDDQKWVIDLLHSFFN